MKDLAWVVGVIAVISVLGIAGFFIADELQSTAFPTFEREPPDDWDPILAPYIDFIEAERGLEFEHPVHVRFTDISAEVAADLEAFRAEEAAVNDGALAFDDPYGDAYELLGLVSFDTDNVQAASDAAIAANAGAFYDLNDQEIVLPEDESEAALRITIVHELVHALQHQHGLIGGFFDSADSGQARLALIEGDAERIALAWFSAQSPSEQQEYYDAIGYDENEPFVEEGNTYLESTFFVSYSLGPPLVETIIATDGIEAFDDLLRAEDIGTTERFIDPLGASDTSSVDAFTEIDLPESAAYADGDLGALTWFAVLAPSAGTEQAFDALIGYDDDAFVIFLDEGGETCGRFAVFFDTAQDAGEFVDITADTLRVQGEAEGRQAVLEVCEPVGDPSEQTPSTMFPLVVASELTLYHVANGETEAVARCAAIDQASTVSATAPLSGFDGYEILIGEADQFVASCSTE